MSDNVLIKDPKAKFGYRATRVDGRKREQNLEPFNRIAHDYLMDNVFTPENAKTATEQADKMLSEEPLFKKGEKVTFINPRYKDQKGWQDDHEILGFMHSGELVDENHASPYDKHYGIRIKNSKTGEEMWTPASYLRRIK